MAVLDLQGFSESSFNTTPQMHSLPLFLLLGYDFSVSCLLDKLGHAYYLLNLFILQEDIALTFIVLTKLKLLQM